ncbi:hypothetical protein Psuf_068320 [Phytohabitans suffuscus]|uniref:Aminotransferase class V domain-containing protein n=1 Tax=Phytohabitans suffuscus TaxID=624315 RepID=A0A6F8YTX4_9ACTN|nr:hypothetical protein Psuf_068320 [Phytohabitans suffuscus]
MLPWYGSVHRGAGARSGKSTLEYELARQAVGDFVGARAGDAVVFTRNTTDALNLLARVLPVGTTAVVFEGSTTPTCCRGRPRCACPRRRDRTRPPSRWSGRWRGSRGRRCSR